MYATVLLTAWMASPALDAMAPAPSFPITLRQELKDLLRQWESGLSPENYRTWRIHGGIYFPDRPRRMTYDRIHGGIE